jgi:hypothetical protein
MFRHVIVIMAGEDVALAHGLKQIADRTLSSQVSVSGKPRRGTRQSFPERHPSSPGRTQSSWLGYDGAETEQTITPCDFLTPEKMEVF